MITLKEKIKNLSDGINEMSDGEMRPVTKKFFENMLEDYKRHAELEDKLEQGTLVELPCKIGDTVYKVNKASRNVRKHKVIQIELILKENGFESQIIFENYNCTFVSHFGKTVFLTESEAQAELERRIHG